MLCFISQQVPPNLIPLNEQHHKTRRDSCFFTPSNSEMSRRRGRFAGARQTDVSAMEMNEVPVDSTLPPERIKFVS